ncbi:hypothetical protein EPUL_005754, partial [Erysiphe pulchra]
MEFSRHVPSLEYSELDDPLKYPMDEDKAHLSQINISQCQELETEPQVTADSQIRKFSRLQDFASVNSMVYDVAKQNENLVEFDDHHFYSQSIKHSHGFISNPISESPEYRAYRARQEDKDFYTDKKWPSMLDNFFLDAMIDIPIMGKKKFTYNGKLHGHNQMISLYIWIAYTESLPSNIAPDPTMIRSRKQISSHIQVLKKLLQGNIAFNHIFSEDIPEGSSFDDNPCLIALSQHRLPSKAYQEQVRKDLHRKLYQLKGQNLPYSLISPPITIGQENCQRQQQEQFSSEHFFKSNVGPLTVSDSNIPTASYASKISPDLGLVEHNQLYQSYFNVPFYDISPLSHQNSNLAYSANSYLPYHPLHTIARDSQSLHSDTYNDNQNKYYHLMASHQIQAQPRQHESESVQQNIESLERNNR